MSADPSISTHNASTLGVAWMTDLGATALASPVVAWNAEDQTTLIFTSNESGYFTAIDVATHEPRWSINFGGPMRGTPLVEGSHVWVAPSNAHRIYKLDAGTGAVQCSAPLPFATDASPTIATPPGGSSTIYMGANDGGQGNGPMTGVNEATCAVRFAATPEPIGRRGGVWDPASYAVSASGEGLVLFGTSDPDSSVYAIDAITGKLVWRYQTQNPPPGIYDVGAGITISPPGVNGFADGVAYAVNKAGYLDALDLTTGALIWTRHLQGTISTPALTGSALVYGDGSRLVSINATNGTLLWQTPLTAPIDGAPTIAGPAGAQVAVYGDMTGMVHVVSVAKGSELYHYRTRSYIVSNLAEYDGNLVATSADGYLYDFAIGGGTGPAPSTATTAPANGSTISNPNGSLSVSGTAGSASGPAVGAVSVAIQSGGSSGPWWDSSSGTWAAAPYGNPATLSAPGSSTTGWSLPFPVPASGDAYEVFASAVAADGVADISAEQSPPTAARSAFVVSPSSTAPRLVISSPWGVPATRLTLSGAGFEAGERVNVTLGGTTLATPTSGSTGKIPKTAFTVPTSAPFGPNSIVANGQSSGRSTTVSIYISNAWSEFRAAADRIGSEANDSVLNDHLSVDPSTFLTEAWSFNSASPIRTSPAVVDAVAYFANDSGAVYAVNVRTGMQKWVHVITGHSPIDSSPAIDPAAGLVVTATNSGRLVALSTSTGAVKWTDQLGTAAIESSPAISQGVVYVGSDDGIVYALNEQTGAIIWQATPSGAVHSSPAVDSAAKLVVVGDDSGAVTALSAQNGSVQWSVPTGAPLAASPVLSGGNVYIGSTSGTMYDLAESAGTKVWATGLGSAITTSAALSGDTLVVGDQNGDLVYLAPGSGHETFSRGLGSPIVGVSNTTGFAVAEASKGRIQGTKGPGRSGWAAQLTGGLASSPTIINGEVLIAGQDGMLHCYTVPGLAPN